MSPSIIGSRRNLLHQWRRQIAQRTRLAQARGPRPFAIVSYLCQGQPEDDGTVDLARLTLVALFDQLLDATTLVTRFVGVAGAIVDEELVFGGDGLCRFDKDLRRPPNGDGRGPRFAADSELLESALALERYLQRCSNHPYMPRRRTPLLPVVPSGVSVNAGCRVDLKTLPKRQVVQLTSPADDLDGRCGTTRFDFCHTRFHVAA